MDNSIWVFPSHFYYGFIKQISMHFCLFYYLHSWTFSKERYVYNIVFALKPCIKKPETVMKKYMAKINKSDLSLFFRVLHKKNPCTKCTVRNFVIITEIFFQVFNCCTLFIFYGNLSKTLIKYHTLSHYKRVEPLCSIWCQYFFPCQLAKWESVCHQHWDKFSARLLIFLYAYYSQYTFNYFVYLFWDTESLYLIPNMHFLKYLCLPCFTALSGRCIGGTYKVEEMFW